MNMDHRFIPNPKSSIVFLRKMNFSLCMSGRIAYEETIVEFRMKS
jgi:hypothetical protein